MHTSNEVAVKRQSLQSASVDELQSFLNWFASLCQLPALDACKVSAKVVVECQLLFWHQGHCPRNDILKASKAQDVLLCMMRPRLNLPV